MFNARVEIHESENVEVCVSFLHSYSAASCAASCAQRRHERSDLSSAPLGSQLAAQNLPICKKTTRYKNNFGCGPARRYRPAAKETDRRRQSHIEYSVMAKSAMLLSVEKRFKTLTSDNNEDRNQEKDKQKIEERQSEEEKRKTKTYHEKEKRKNATQTLFRNAGVIPSNGSTREAKTSIFTCLACETTAAK